MPIQKEIKKLADAVEKAGQAFIEVAGRRLNEPNETAVEKAYAAQQANLAAKMDAMKKYQAAHPQLDTENNTYMSAVIRIHEALHDNPHRDPTRTVQLALKAAYDRTSDRDQEKIDGYEAAIFGSSLGEQYQKCSELSSIVYERANKHQSTDTALAEYGAAQAKLMSSKSSVSTAMSLLEEVQAQEKQKKIPDQGKLLLFSAEASALQDLQKEQARSTAREIMHAIAPSTFTPAQMAELANNPDALQQLAQNKLGNNFNVSPMPSGNNIMVRVDHGDQSFIVKISAVERAFFENNMSYNTDSVRNKMEAQDNFAEVYQHNTLRHPNDRDLYLEFEVCEFVHGQNLERKMENRTANFPEPEKMTPDQILAHQGAVLKEMQVDLADIAKGAKNKIYPLDYKPSNILVRDGDNAHLTSDTKLHVDVSKTKLTDSAVNDVRVQSTYGDVESRDPEVMVRQCFARSLVHLVAMSPHNDGDVKQLKLDDPNDPLWNNPMFNNETGQAIKQLCMDLQNPKFKLSDALEAVEKIQDKIAETQQGLAQAAEFKDALDEPAEKGKQFTAMREEYQKQVATSATSSTSASATADAKPADNSYRR